MKRLLRLVTVVGALLTGAGLCGTDPLHNAAQQGNLAEVKRLVEQEKIDVDSKCILGLTPLAWASIGGHLDVATYLVSKGAWVNAADSHSITPLHRACRWGHVGVVEFLIENGARIHAIDKWGKTPLHEASTNGHPEVVQYLLSKGADVKAEDLKVEGKTPLYYACSRIQFAQNPFEAAKYMKVIESLIAHGAGYNDITMRMFGGLLLDKVPAICFTLGALYHNNPEKTGFWNEIKSRNKPQNAGFWNKVKNSAKRLVVKEPTPKPREELKMMTAMELWDLWVAAVNYRCTAAAKFIFGELKHREIYAKLMLRQMSNQNQRALQPTSKTTEAKKLPLCQDEVAHIFSFDPRYNCINGLFNGVEYFAKMADAMNLT